VRVIRGSTPSETRCSRGREIHELRALPPADADWRHGDKGRHVLIVTSREQRREEWRPGVLTRLWAAAATGTTKLCVIEQWCDPRTGAPTHTHFDAEEVLLVAEGSAEVWVGDERRVVESGSAVIIPPQHHHGFINTGKSTLRIFAIFSASAPKAEYRQEPGTVLEIGVRRERMKDAHRAIRSLDSSISDRGD
jgi:mannose-6-phosphate isomerase-like protein (cupin superfamily)